MKRWLTTAELAREFGFPVKLIQRRVKAGELHPTWRTEHGLPRWRRADFAAQTAPDRGTVHVPDPEESEDGAVCWPALARVVARPGRTIEVRYLGLDVYLDGETARQLAYILPAAAEVADERPPRCTCRDLMRDGHIEMIVPVPSCPEHLGATP